MSDLDINIHLVETLDDALEFKRWMSRGHPFLAIDTETGGIEWWKYGVRLFQIGNRYEAWAIPWHHWAGLIFEVLEAFTGELVFHNAKFDVTMIEQTAADVNYKPGFKLPRYRIHDTAILANILDPSKPIGLKPLSARNLHPQLASDEQILHHSMEKNGWTWETVPTDFPPYWMYGGLDCVRTARLFEIMKPKVLSDAPRAYEVELAMTWILQSMEIKGIEIDTDYAERALESKEKEIQDLKIRCEREYNAQIGSSQSVIGRLQYLTGYEFTKQTEKGGLALDNEVLLDVAEKTQHPLAQAVMTLRKKQKVCSTYLRKLTSDGFFSFVYDGRVHPSFNANDNYGARTGRMSVKNPSLQNLPRASGDPDYDTVRDCFVASNMGDAHTLVLCDFDQIEARIMASISRDPNLIEAFNPTNGVDFFTNIARDVYEDPTLTKKDPRRQSTKNFIYSRMFGAGLEKMASTAGVSVDQASKFMNKFDTLYPGLDQLTNAVVNKATERHTNEGVAYVRDLLTKRRLPADNPDKAYVLVNYLIQSSAAQVLKTKNIELSKAGLLDYLVLNVHDEVILDVPTEESEEVAREVEKIMGDDTMFSVPLTAESVTSWCWGQKETEYANKPGERILR